MRSNMASWRIERTDGNMYLAVVPLELLRIQEIGYPIRGNLVCRLGDTAKVRFGDEVMHLRYYGGGDHAD
jgi:hypothetical protein